MQTILRVLSLALALTIVAALPALAQTAAPAPPAADAAPAKKSDASGRKTPVAIDHDDNDPVGTRLAYRLKELLGRSSLMQPTNKDEKKIVIVLKTKEEFPGRSGLSSIYSISWLFSSKEGALKYFLTSEAGIVDSADIDQVTETILGKTDKLASTYGYLF
ncbi:MAG: hypothetical protein ACP59X_20065 [Solidesulfovibrio sp. DCME]|uniref:hypothetical protein n=1 Tax=Solidesulfovibrio sp. DCME TaxID=3447380 RepID=UPI003D13A0AB